MNSRRWIALAALIAVAFALLSACGGGDSKSSTPTAAAGKVTYNGGVATPAFQKPDMTINDTSGKPFDIKKETEGYLTLFYLGYTNCPDVCPTQMADIGASLKALPADVTSKIKVVFVTSDPARDTGPVLSKWLGKFDPNFIGLVPTPDQLAKIADALDMPPIQTEQIPGGGYAVDHAAYVLAYTKDNLAHVIYPSGVTTDDYKADLPNLALHGFQAPAK
ncbi:MAG: SCO family protein [Tepidiformaceae bacterium]